MQALLQTHALAYSPPFLRTRDAPQGSLSCTSEIPSPLPTSPCVGRVPCICPPRSPSCLDYIYFRDSQDVILN